MSIISAMVLMPHGGEQLLRSQLTAPEQDQKAGDQDHGSEAPGLEIAGADLAGADDGGEEGLEVGHAGLGGDCVHAHIRPQDAALTTSGA